MRKSLTDWVVSQFEKSDRERVFDAAGLTLEEIMGRAPWYGPKGTSRFVFDEAIGALVVRPECRAELTKAFHRQKRKLQLRLYRHLAVLYLRKLALELRYVFRALIYKFARSRM